jgi:succinyl-CoA synthetase beta subunit
VIEAASKLKVKVPVVIRLEGTNVEKGRSLLRASGFDFTVASGMRDAAEKSVQLAANA